MPLTALGRTTTRMDWAGHMDVSREAAAGHTAERNVSIATVVEDFGTTVTGIQTAITLHTLVMASLMITGGKVGQILGRKRAFAIGCVIYGCGSLITALTPNLAVLMLGWSVLEGMGAALIMPAIVALVASNFARDQPPPRVRVGGVGRRDRGGGRACHAG
jgi:MFS family permease